MLIFVSCKTLTRCLCNMVIPLISRVMYVCYMPHQTRDWDWQYIYPV